MATQSLFMVNQHLNETAHRANGLKKSLAMSISDNLKQNFFCFFFMNY